MISLQRTYEVTSGGEYLEQKETRDSDNMQVFYQVSSSRDVLVSAKMTESKARKHSATIALPGFGYLKGSSRARIVHRQSFLGGYPIFFASIEQSLLLRNTDGTVHPRVTVRTAFYGPSQHDETREDTFQGRYPYR